MASMISVLAGLMVLATAASACSLDSDDPSQTSSATVPPSSITAPSASAPGSAPAPGSVSPGAGEGGTREPILGEVFTSGAVGYGQVRPGEIDAAGGATAVITGVVWDSWGGAEAIGTGQAIYVPPGEPNAAGQPEPADLVASDLGECPSGQLAYRSLTWTFPAHPEAPSAGFLYICALSGSEPVPTTLAPAVFSGYPVVREGTEEWLLLGCDAGRPLGEVTAMGGAERDFRSGGATAIRQVAVFADADNAAAEAQRLGQVARDCEGTTSPERFEAPQVQALGVGADAVLLQVPIVDGGQVAAVLRRGTAVALVAAIGSFSAGNDLDPVVRQAASDVFLQLCPYERGDNC